MLDRFIGLVSLGFFGFALWLIYKEVHLIGEDRLVQLLLETPWWVLAMLIILTGLNYLVLSGYDVLGLAYIGKHLPWPNILKTSSLSFALSNTTGHIYAAGGAVRYLFYVPEGITRKDVLKMIIFETIGVLLGMVAAFELAVLIRIFEPFDLLGHKIILYVGATILLLLSGIYCVRLSGNHAFHIGKETITPPSKSLTFKQILVGLCDNLTLFLVFYVALRYHLEAPFGITFIAFILAQSIGFATQVPGGIGVFEGAFFYLFPHAIAEKGAILSSLILFRVVYYFVPFVLGSLYMGYRLWQRKRRPKSPSSV